MGSWGFYYCVPFSLAQIGSQYPAVLETRTLNRLFNVSRAIQRHMSYVSMKQPVSCPILD